MKFCFYGYDILGAFKGQTKGGGELQIVLLAKSLALKGHEVVIIDPCTETDYVDQEGIKILSVPNWNKGFRGFRMLFTRIPALWKVFSAQKADYYYVRMSAYLHLIPYRAAKKHGGKFIQAVACDLDVLSIRKRFKYQYKTDFKLFHFLTVSLPSDLVLQYLLKKSDYVILQHQGQKFESPSIQGKIVVFPNVIDRNNLPVVLNPSKKYFIHVGSLTTLKGSGNLHKLIGMLNSKDTLVIVGQPNDKKSKIILDQINKVSNVIVKQRLSHNETLELIANAKALINTSNFEGFPNIFLEAWANGVPVISLRVNPGDVFYKYDLGICCKGDFTKMKSYMESYKMTDFDTEKMKSYVHQFHDFNTAGERFLNAIDVPE